MPYIGKEPKTITTISDLTATGTTALTGNATAAGTLDVTGAITSSAGATITTSDNTAQLTLTSTDADASVGPVLDLVRDSGSPADSDLLGSIKFIADDDGGNETTFASISTQIGDASNGTESSALQIKAMNAGSLVSRADFLVSETVFNNGSIDLDFRVEGNGNANALFVQGSDDFIGIGTGTPKKKLHIQDTTSDGIIILDRNGTSADHQICFAHNYQSGSQSGGNYYAIGVDDSENKLVFAFDANSQASLSADAKMVLDSSGNVGIGTSSPSRKLELNNGATGTLVTFTDGVATNFTFKTDGSNVGTFGTEAGSTTLAFMSSGVERMRVASGGQVMVGDTTGGNYSDGGLFTRHAGGANNSPFCVVNGTTSGTRRMIDFFVGTGTSRVGSIQSNDSATAFNTSSDYRLKENVADMTGAIDRVKALAPKRFNFIVSPDTTVDGFLAHEVSSIVPEAISGVKDEVAIWGKEEKLPDGVKVGDNKLDDDGNTIPIMQGIDHSKLVPLLTAALKEAVAKIESLEARVTALEG